MKKLFIISICLMGLTSGSFGQTLTQTVKGKVVDKATQEELFGATITLLGSDPLMGTVVGPEGYFVLDHVPVGRQSFEFRSMGYEPYTVREVLVTSGKEVILNIGMEVSMSTMEELVVVYERPKDQPINEMAAVSSRQFTVEETQRYAGGLSDPARLVSSFAGVATPSLSSNGISVRGNTPSGLLWRIEGVEVPSPNHFADLSIAGAGLLTALTSQVLSNSDFMTGAFPSEYGNATSGVFDMSLRTGNPSTREHTAQIGILGVDFATEGPFKKGQDDTYLFNYRYSTLGLIAPLLPSDAGVLKYQDLTFNMDLPTEHAGNFSFWGVAALDGVDMEVPDSSKWTSETDRENSQTSMYLYATGVNHELSLNKKRFVTSSLSFSGNGLSFQEQYVDDLLQEIPTSDAARNNYRITLQSTLNSYVNRRHFNKTGFYINGLMYDLDIDHAIDETAPLRKIAEERGRSMRYQFYTQSQFDLSSRLKLNAGFHSQYFQLNKELTFEPRVSLDYALSELSNVAIAYGLHSQTESLGFYFIKDDLGNEPNRDLKLMKSHHIVISYRNQLSQHINLRVEPYYQYLTDVPVSPDSYISTLNTQDNVFFDEVLVSEGTGRNVGVDFTLEQYLHNGFYALLTASVFDSKYTAADGIERNTRLNKNYVGNVVVGKEWQVGRGKNNTFSANVRLNYLGGNREEAINVTSSIEEDRIVFEEVGDDISFTNRLQDVPIYSFTLSYRKNKPKFSSVWSLQILNASQTEEFDGHIISTEDGTVSPDHVAIIVPNLSYKIEF